MISVEQPAKTILRPDGLSVLSPFQQRICSLLAEDLSVEEIAAKLNSTPSSIRVMVYRACRATGVRTKIGLVVLYIRSYPSPHRLMPVTFQ